MSVDPWRAFRSEPTVQRGTHDVGVGRTGSTARRRGQFLAAGPLLGLAVVAVWPAGWPVDPVIALGIAAWSAWAGRQAWRGDGCC